MAGMGNFMVILPLIFLVNKIDFTEEFNVLALRVVFGVVHVSIFLILGLIYQKINAANDTTVVPPAKEDEEPTTVVAHDLAQLMKYLKSICITLCIIGFLHIKMGVFPPLAIQSVINPLNLYKNNLFKVYILGSQDPEILKRPWVEESPFAAAAAAAAGEETEGEEVAPAPESMDQLEEKKPKAKKDD